MKNKQIAEMQAAAKKGAATKPEPAPPPLAKAEPPKAAVPEKPAEIKPDAKPVAKSDASGGDVKPVQSADAKPGDTKADMASAGGPGAASPAPTEEAKPETAVPPPAASPAPMPSAADEMATKPKPKPVAKPKPKPEPSFIDSILDNSVVLGGGVAAIVAIGLGGMYAYRRRKRAAADSGDSSVGAIDSGEFSASGGQTVDTGQSVLQSDFGPGGISALDTDDVDPIAEADVYMAYGRDAQAEEILKEAMLKSPDNQAVQAKLAEIYANRSDTSAFLAVAQQLRGASNGEGPHWAAVAALGQKLAPDNALFGGGTEDLGHSDTQILTVAQTQPVAAAAPASPSGVSTVILPGQVSKVAEATADTPLDNISTIVLNTSPVQAAAEPAPAASTADTLAFDLGFDVAETAAAAAAPEQESTIDTGGGGLDFDLGLGDEAPAAEKPTEEFKTESGAGATLDFDMGFGNAEPAPAAEGGIDLDLGAAEPTVDKPLGDDLIRLDSPASGPDDGGLDFDLGGDAPAGGMEGITLDIGPDEIPGGQSGDAKWAEIATKLDLAKAYEEMGDKDGARELLHDVVRDGDDAQQAQAREMLASL
jgi:pilus assembly protein FimV